MGKLISLAEASEPFMDGYNKALEKVEKLIANTNYEKDSDWNNFVSKFIELKKEFALEELGEVKA